MNYLLGLLSLANTEDTPIGLTALKNNRKKSGSKKESNLNLDDDMRWLKLIRD